MTSTLTSPFFGVFFVMLYNKARQPITLSKHSHWHSTQQRSASSMPQSFSGTHRIIGSDAMSVMGYQSEQTRFAKVTIYCSVSCRHVYILWYRQWIQICLISHTPHLNRLGPICSVLVVRQWHNRFWPKDDIQLLALHQDYTITIIIII